MLNIAIRVAHILVLGGWEDDSLYVGSFERLPVA